MTDSQITTAYIHLPYLVTAFCGAVILILLDIWLRRRGVKDPSLVWLYVCLLSWAAAIAVQLLEFRWLETFFNIQPKDFKYLVSPLSTILFSLTTFRLSRVRDALPARKLRLWRNTILTIVALISAIAVFLMLTGNPNLGGYVDATASSIAGLALAIALSYSFYKYNNHLFIWLTWLTFPMFIYRQFYIAAFGTPQDAVFILLFFTNSTFVVLLFIALAIAWGLSGTSRLKFTGEGVNVDVIALSMDLRGSTRWANEEVGLDFKYIGAFMDDLREWSLGRASTFSCGHLNLVKFLGDGFLFVWEVRKELVGDSAKSAVRLAYALNTDYLSWIQGEEFKRKYTWGVPVGVGIGVDAGWAIRLTSENGSDDYLGAPLNYSAKMQDLARPRGVVIQKKVWKNLDEEFRGKFPQEAVMKLGNSNITVRMTQDVEFRAIE